MTERRSERRIARTFSLKGDPIHYAGEEITRLEFRKPRAGDLRLIDDAEAEAAQGLTLLGALVDLPEETIDELDLEDLSEALDIVEQLWAPFTEKAEKKKKAGAGKAKAAGGRRPTGGSPSRRSR